jgi:hypothetical protein
MTEARKEKSAKLSTLSFFLLVSMRFELMKMMCA